MESVFGSLSRFVLPWSDPSWDNGPDGETDEEKGAGVPLHGTAS
jgi:hypothetical protein